MARISKRQEAESLAWLRDELKPGDTVTTVLRHRSRSGMHRAIDAYALTCGEDGPSRRWLSYHVARAGVGRWDDRREAVGMSGAGMDMGFQLVYVLSTLLFPDGFTCTGSRCPSNDHSNGDRDYSPHHHASGGYALRHEWL